MKLMEAILESSVMMHLWTLILSLALHQAIGGIKEILWESPYLTL